MKTHLLILIFLFFITFTNLLNAQFAQNWAERYNGPGNNFDVSYSIALDASGNIYITGSSVGSGTSDDFTTIKYNSSGVQQWVQRYNGPGNGIDIAYSIATDVSGNVYVTGQSAGNGTSADYATIKYNTSGVQLWVIRYNGAGGVDEPMSIAVDGSGNVYVTGTSFGSGTNFDCATIKYNSAGVQQWAARYNGTGNGIDWAYSIAVDGSGYVYVTGGSAGSGTDIDYVTIKYNPSGLVQWVQRYNGPGNGFDQANCLKLDASGNVYVTGESIGNGSNYDYATIKYSASGIQQWVARYNGPGNGSDRSLSMALYGTGNIYVTGVSVGSGTSYDCATIKYNSSGVQQWVARYNGIGNAEDESQSIAIDSSGNPYITGQSTGISTGKDYTTIKYNTTGAQQWVAKYNESGGDDIANSIAVDGNGFVYITGGSTGIGTNTDFCTIKYTQLPAAPNLLFPPNNSTNISLTPLLDWSDVPAANTYRVQVSTNSGFSSFVVNQTGLTVSGYQVPSDSLQNSILYYWRACAVNQAGAGSWSDIWLFTTAPIGIKTISREIPKEYKLYNNYPNPFNPVTMIKFDIAKESNIKLIIYDILGRQVTSLVNEKLNPGSYEVEWDASNFTSRVYFYKLETESFNETKRMVLVK